MKIILLYLLMIISLSSCAYYNEDNLAHHRNVFAMDTYMTLTAYGKYAEIGLYKAEEKIHKLEELMSVTKNGSEICRINNSAGRPVIISKETADVISLGLEFGRLTDGALDITIYPIIREWGFTGVGQLRNIPKEEKINDLLKNVGYENVMLINNIVTIPKDYKLDLGSLAKGYTSDIIIDILRENDVNSAIISLGGNVKTLGTKPNGNLWNIAVKSPFDDKYIGYIEIGEKAVVTSGYYERCFKGTDGKIYHHIIDPTNGYPADKGLVSVTIIAESGIMCDALSTALYVTGKEKAVQIWKARNDFDMILISDDNKIIYSDGIIDNFTNTSNFKVEVLHHD